MTCGYCQLANNKEEHRCARCGRRLTGTPVAAPVARTASQPTAARAPSRMALRTAGATALAAQPVPSQSAPRTQPRVPEISMDMAATLDGLPRPRVKPVQPSLFGAELQPKLIPFESRSRGPEVSSGIATGAAVLPSPVMPISIPVETKPAAKPATRRAAPIDDPQATLDFLPPLKTPGRPVKTEAQAVIFCDAAVAGPIHRTTAAALDLAMITIAFSGVLAIFEWFAKPVLFDRLTLVMLGGMLGITALFYGLLFAISGTVTPGMRWTHLRLITFDGFPLDSRNRALRFAGTWIGVLSGGIGLFWALLDEENLTWHDHMSKTFPTLRESNSTVVRQKRR